MRRSSNITAAFKMVDTCAAEFASTPYYYSVYDGENEAVSAKAVEGSRPGPGPIRIGQGIEFDFARYIVRGHFPVRAGKQLL